MDNDLSLYQKIFVRVGTGDKVTPFADDNLAVSNHRWPRETWLQEALKAQRAERTKRWTE